MTDKTSDKVLMLKKTWWLALPFAGLVIFVVVSAAGRPDDEATTVQSVQVVNTYPHDPDAFSQGLVVEGDVLYEGTGHYGESTLRKVDLTTGTVQMQIPLGPRYFGEGITILGNRIYQLTWREHVCIVYDKSTLKAIGSLPYSGEGWGLTDDEKLIYLSDGTPTIRVLDPQTFKVLRRIRVKQGRRRIDNLNELEFVGGEILANVWYSDRIARIDPQTGSVLGWIDCSAIYPAHQRPDREHVLNGIAFDHASGRLFVTGKNWPQLFEIKVVSGEK